VRTSEIYKSPCSTNDGKAKAEGQKSVLGLQHLNTRRRARFVYLLTLEESEKPAPNEGRERPAGAKKKGKEKKAEKESNRRCRANSTQR